MLVKLNLRELERELGDDVDRFLLELSNEIVNKMLRPESEGGAPVGATGTLRDSIQIFRRGDGVVFLGARTSYAADVVEGQPPHTPDFDDIQVWARRKLGDEALAGPVWRKIRAEGTEPNDFVGRAIDDALDEMT